MMLSGFADRDNVSRWCGFAMPENSRNLFVAVVTGISLVNRYWMRFDTDDSAAKNAVDTVDL